MRDAEDLNRKSATIERKITEMYTDSETNVTGLAQYLKTSHY